MSKNLVKSELKNKIFFLELNNPQSQNTLSEKMIEELTENFKLASEFFAEKGFFVLRMGQDVETKFNNNNPKIIDYANTKFRSDFMDIYLLSKCEFLLGGDSGVHVVPFVFNRAVYGINYTFSLLWQVHKLYLKLFIFKRIKNLEISCMA